MQKLKNGLLVIPVPKDAEDFVVKNYPIAGKWLEEKNSKNFNAWKTPLDKKLTYQIIGIITKDETTIDSKILADYDINYEPNTSVFSRFKSMIEAETGYLFENKPRPKCEDYANQEVRDIWMQSDLKTWQQHQDRVIEKLVVIKEI